MFSSLKAICEGVPERSAQRQGYGAVPQSPNTNALTQPPIFTPKKLCKSQG